ncbi:MAG: hypothetical protein WD250_00430 [Egibacteraceae bacterium]
MSVERATAAAASGPHRAPHGGDTFTAATSPMRCSASLSNQHQVTTTKAGRSGDLNRAKIVAPVRLYVPTSGGLHEHPHAATGLADPGSRPVDARHLVVSVIALCFFPLAHARTLVAPLGLDPDSAAFLAERKAHVIDLLLHGLRVPPRHQ